VIDVTNFHETPSMENLPDDGGGICGCSCACGCTDACSSSNSASPPIGSGSIISPSGYA